MSGADYLRDGDWNFICDQCGFKGKASDGVKQWDGLYVHRTCADPRHPQDFVRGRRDKQTVPWSRPQSPTPSFILADVYVDESFAEYIDDSGFHQYVDG